jgi:hypothetical protein
VKTQIIQLNNNDDYISLRDKMSWTQTGRILLVWPKQGHMFNRQLELNLVKHYASTIGAQLALVTHDSEVRFYADRIGIPVFEDVRHAQATHWRVGRSKMIDIHRNFLRPDIDYLHKTIHPKSAAWLEHPALRIVIFGISVLSLFALGIFIVPGAMIILTPKVETQSTIFTLTADPELTTINLSTGSLPTYSQEVIVEGRDSITTTGSVIIPNQVAIGSLRFINISDQQIIIPPGTIVATNGSDPVRFITSNANDITITAGKSATLMSRAIKPGTSGNLRADKLVIIEGDLGLDLSVTNPYATHGGTDATVSSPTQDDINFLRDRLTNTLRQEALREMQSILPVDDVLISPTLNLLETLVETSTPEVGAPGIHIDLSLRLKFQSQVVSAEVIRSLVTPVMNSSVSAGYSPILNTLVINQLSIPTRENDGKAHWTIRAQRNLQADIPISQAIDIVKGVTISQAVVRLNDSLPLAELPNIQLAPSWWPRLPFLSMRIQVINANSR